MKSHYKGFTMTKDEVRAANTRLALYGLRKTEALKSRLAKKKSSGSLPSTSEDKLFKGIDRPGISQD